MKSDIEKILVIHRHGGLGDLLCSSPVLEALKCTWPGAAITLLMPPPFTSLMRQHPFVDRIWPGEENSPGSGGLFSQAARIRSEGFDLVVVLWSTAREAWLSFLGGVPVRVGQAGRLLYSFLYTHRVPVRAAKGDVTSHWVDSQLDFARSLGIEPSPPRILVPVDESDRGRIDQALEADGVSASDRLIALHTGKGMNLDSRRWPVEVFSAFGDILAAELGAKVILTGTREEKPLVDAVAQGMKQPVLNWAGTTSLGELAALLERCRVVVCPDSGPMHLAAAVGTPVAAIFALKSDFPLRWHPYGVPMEILVPADRHCTRKCVKETCPRFSCFEDITPGEVLEAVKRLLEPFTIKSGPAVFLDRDGTVVEDAGYIADPGRLRLLPKAAPAIARLNRLGFPVICVSNQSGVARGYFGEDRVRRVNRALDVLLAGRGARIDRYYFCPHLPEGKVAAYRTVCNCRKPAPGMLQDAVRDLGINLPESYLVGDKLSDLAAGNNAGCRTILVLTGEGTRTRTQLDRLEKPPDFIADNLGGAVEWIEAQERSHP